MRREDKRKDRLADQLRATRHPMRGDYFGWFRFRTSEAAQLQDIKPVVGRLEPVEDPEPPPHWFYDCEYLFSMEYREESARHDDLAPGSLALLRVSPPVSYKSWTDCGWEYDTETAWEILCVLPHPCFDEAWTRTLSRLAFLREAKKVAQVAAVSSAWRQPWKMAIDLKYHDGTTFQYASEGYPGFDERLRNYVACLVHSPSFDRRGGVFAAKHWLAYGKERKTEEEALASLAEVVKEMGHRLDLSKIRTVHSRVW